MINNILHYWYHQYNNTKRYIQKDPSTDWWYSYNALHNLPSEKLINLVRHGNGSQNQLWALYNIKNYYWRWSNHE